MASKTWTATSAGSFSTGGNYDDNTAPASGDTVKFNSLSVSNVTSGLSNTNIASLTLDCTGGYTGQIGVESSGTNGASYLTLGSTGTQTVYVGRNDGGTRGNGPSLFLCKPNSSGTVNVYVYSTGTSANNYPAACLLGQAVNLFAYGGECGFAVRPGETGTLSGLTLSTSPEVGANGKPVVRLGKGVTLPGVMNIDAGVCYNRSSSTAASVVVSGSGTKYVVESEATGAHTAIDIEGGTVIYNGAGAIGAATVRASCTLDLTQDSQAGKQVGPITAYEGASILLDNGANGSITGTGGGTNVVTITCVGDLRKIKISKPLGMTVKLL